MSTKPETILVELETRDEVNLDPTDTACSWTLKSEYVTPNDIPLWFVHCDYEKCTHKIIEIQSCDILPTGETRCVCVAVPITAADRLAKERYHLIKKIAKISGGVNVAFESYMRQVGATFKDVTIKPPSESNS